MPFEHYIDVVEDLSRDLPVQVRYRRLLEAIHYTIPYDAIALLQLLGDELHPVAFIGLREETSGRRFLVEHHPRLAAILQSRELVRFDASCDLPDPYDGLLNTPDHELFIHDCMGVSIYFADQPWGVITFDGLQAGQFDEVDAKQQALAITLTRAVVTAAERINQLQNQLNLGHQVTIALNRERSESDIIGSSTIIQRLINDIDVVAPTPLSVLIEGETGVGKELIARRLHLKSDRYDRPLIHVNCAALPENLAEAELFGHTKGAFTGATAERVGRFELADGGTLFLDEVGELPLSLQAKLLRALQEGEVQRVGSDQIIKVDVRIIAATNRDLQQEVDQGRFRADLYHRLSVFPVTVPPLRERGRDVLQLAEFFLERDQFRLNIQTLCLTENARLALLHYAWPGNVRELEHLLSRAALKASQQNSVDGLVQVSAKHLGLSDDIDEMTPMTQMTEPSPHTTSEIGSLTLLTQSFQTQLIQSAIKANHGNIAAAARALEVDRSNLFRLMKRLNIQTISNENQ